MSQTQENQPENTSSTKSDIVKTIIASSLTLMVLVAGGIYWFTNGSTEQTAIVEPSQKDDNLPSLSYSGEHNSETAGEENAPSFTLNSTDNQIATASTASPTNLEQTENKNLNSVENAKEATSSTKEISQEDASEHIDAFLGKIERSQYYSESFAQETAEIHFAELIQKIINNPPVVSGEKDDLYTLLQNTAHLFRVVGGNNIALLKEIVRVENAEMERVAADLFFVLSDEKTLMDKYGITVNATSLYNYGCFFLNTMGGRLYMFRRNLEMRLIISYYSLLLVYDAEINGTNHHGVDVRPFLKNLIYEMENYGQKLTERDTYLARLYNLESALN